MELLYTWRNLYKLRYCPVTLIQTAFAAGTVYLLIAMQASTRPRIARKEFRHSMGQETLVLQYLQEIGLSWNCATPVSVTLRKLMDEQVRPHLDIMDRKSIPTTLGLHISTDIDDGKKENNASRSRSSSRKRSSITELGPQISHPHTMPNGSGSGQPSLSTITVSSACDTSSIHAAPPAPTAIQSLSSSNPSSFTDSWAFQPNPGSSPNFNYLSSSSAHPDFWKYAQPFSNFMDNPFSGDGNRSSDDVEGLVSYLAQPFVGFLDGVQDTRSPDFPNFVQAPITNGFLNHEPSSTSPGEHAPPSSHGGNDNMNFDSVPRMPSFTS